MLTFVQIVAVCCMMFVMSVILMVITGEVLKQVVSYCIEKYMSEQDHANKKATRRALKMTKKMLED